MPSRAFVNHLRKMSTGETLLIRLRRRALRRWPQRCCDGLAKHGERLSCKNGLDLAPRQPRLPFAPCNSSPPGCHTGTPDTGSPLINHFLYELVMCNRLDFRSQPLHASLKLVARCRRPIAASSVTAFPLPAAPSIKQRAVFQSRSVRESKAASTPRQSMKD